MTLVFSDLSSNMLERIPIPTKTKITKNTKTSGCCFFVEMAWGWGATDVDVVYLLDSEEVDDADDYDDIDS